MKTLKTRTKKFVKVLYIIAICLLSTILGFVAYYFAVTSGTKLDIRALNLQTQNNSCIVDASGNYAFSIGGGNKTKLKDLNANTINAFVSIEDKRFYSHNGLDYYRMLGALLKNLSSGKLKEGGSTISQQLIKNTSLSRDKTINRKLKEIKLAKELEKIFTKNEILELYLNTIYFGGGCYGIKDASSYYFNKEPADLTLAESAFLAAVINAPGLYNPQTNLEGAIKRKNLVLAEMKKDGPITKEQYSSATEETLEFAYNKPNNAFIKSATQEAINLLNVTENNIANMGLKIYTNLDATLQNYLDDLIKNKNIFNAEENKNPFASIMVLDNSGTSVIAYASSNSAYNGFIKRQSGSVLKPLSVYAPALESGKIYPSSLILDEAININGYAPENADNKYHGYVSARYSLEKSLNIPAVKIMEMVSPQNSIEFLKGFGINLSSEDANLSLSLGSTKNGICDLSLSGAYATLANGGKYIKPSFITKIEDKNGIVIYKNKQESSQACSIETAYLLTDILKGTSTKGTAKRIGDMGYNVASKTGTVGLKNSNQNCDAYCVSYTTRHTILSHIYSSESPMPASVNGSTYPCFYNKFILNKLYNTSTPPDFIKPDGVVEKNIDTLIEETSHKIVLATEDTPQKLTREELFNSKFLPPDNILFNSLEIKGYIENYTMKIEVPTNKSSSYKIYRNGEEMANILGNGEIVKITDQNAIKNTLLEYFVIETNYRNEQILSNKVTIFYT